jgi:hypothetical protein
MLTMPKLIAPLQIGLLATCALLLGGGFVPRAMARLQSRAGWFQFESGNR